MCVNNLSKVTLDSAAAGIEPAISSRKSSALTTTPPSSIVYIIAIIITRSHARRRSKSMKKANVEPIAPLAVLDRDLNHALYAFLTGQLP